MARAQLDALAGVVEDLAGQFELHPLRDRILRHAAGLLDCRSGSICTVDERAGPYRKEVDLGVACRSGDQSHSPRVSPARSCARAVRSPSPNTRRSAAGTSTLPDRADPHATIGVPIRRAGAVIGTCIVLSRDPGRRFDASDVILLERFAGHARQAARTALTQTRRTALGMRPAMTPTPTLEQAVQTQVAWARSTDLDIDLVVAGPPRTLPAGVTDGLFGLAQQAIANIVAHADARTGRGGLRRERGRAADPGRRPADSPRRMFRDV